MIETAQRSDFDEMARQLDRVVDKLLHRSFSPLRTHHCWTPAINAYRVPQGVEICVELAGVDEKTIEVTVEPGRLTIRGVRATPQPPSAPVSEAGECSISVLAMEIDDGPFERMVQLPRDLDIRRISAEQLNGLLWVRLPLAKPKA